MRSLLLACFVSLLILTKPLAVFAQTPMDPPKEPNPPLPRTDPPKEPNPPLPRTDPPVGPGSTPMPPVGPPKKNPEDDHPSKIQVGGKTMDEWVLTLSDKDPSVRVLALRMLSLYGPTARKSSAKALLALLKDQDLMVRLNAIVLIGEQGFVPPEEWLKEANPTEVPKIDPYMIREPGQTAEMVKQLRTYLDAQNFNYRLQAAIALGKMGWDARSATDDLLKKCLNDQTTYELRKAAVAALGRIAFEPKTGPYPRAVVALAGALADPSSEVRREAVQSLLNLGIPMNPNPADVAALRGLITKHAYKDPDRAVAIWARVYLMKLDPKEITETNLGFITATLKNKDAGQVVQALNAMAALDKQVIAKLNEVLPCLDREEPLVVYTAIKLLESFGPTADKATPILERIAKSHKEEAIRKAAEEALDLILEKKKPKK